ncbi:MAG: hypothetical protein AAF690_29765 [Acidobacteriota bacterium]
MLDLLPAPLRLRALCALLLACALSAPGGAQTDLDPELLSGMKFRSIGPAGMSGRVAAIDAVIDDPKTIWVGAATGGVWRSDDGGASFRPVFDDQPVAAIGAVAIDQNAPDTVWVGTGEGNPRNSVSVGRGLYRTHDGGQTWDLLGLEETERIHRILLHPRDPETLWVCAMGKAWGANEERGVFRTRDGGATWQKVLYVDENTGCADLVVDPSNPETLMAAMWQYRRFPHFFRSGGPSSGLFRSTDGGSSWQRAQEMDGMPKGDLGRIGLAFAPSDPSIAYALVEAQQNALLRSEDGGRTWRTVNSSPGVSPRPFYYADLRVDPERPERVYRLQSTLDVSTDGGRSFSQLASFTQLHPDHHELWIHPHDADLLIAGNDGGVGISRDRGGSWDFVRNLPLAQYYHVRVDDEVPYNVYGGLQDNGSWKGPSAVWEQGFGGGIRNFHWTMVAFGDGFDTAPDPDDASRGYAMSQGGNLSRWNLSQGGGKAIRPDGPDDEVLRFNWNAGFAQDPFASGTIYYGSQYLHRSTDRGESWTRISEDLTTDNEEWQLQDQSGGLTLDVTAAENFTTIITVEPSDLEEGVLWVGTDDGRVHITRDGGDSWTSLEEKAWKRGVPENTWVPHITASKHSKGEAFVVFDNHRRSDLSTYVFRVSDYGERWERLVDPKSDQANAMGYALKVEQDPQAEEVLFLGAEFGLWVSLDAGDSWFKWTHGVPTVSVMDMAIQEREQDLVLGTHGRAIFVLDDISPLRTVAEAMKLAEEETKVHLFDVGAAQQYQAGASPGELMPGTTEFRGENQAYGALMTFVVLGDDVPHPDSDVERAKKEEEHAERVAAGTWASYGEGEEAAPGAGGPPRRGPRGGRGRGGDGPKAKIEIFALDDSPVGEADEVLRKLEVPVKRGVNRAVWSLRTDSFERPGRSGGGFFGFGGGPEVPPGRYGVRLSFGKASATSTVEVVADPRIEHSDADRLTNWETIQQAGGLQERLAEMVERIGSLRSDIEVVQRKERESKKDEPTEGAQEEGEEATATDAEEGAEEAAEEEVTTSSLAKNAVEQLEDLEKKIWTKPGAKGIPARNRALNRVGSALGSLQSSWDPPNPTQATVLRQVTALVDGLESELGAIESGVIAELRTAIEGMQLLAPKEE